MEGAARRITELRDRAGLSQGRLAKAVGLSREQLNRIEKGSRSLSHAEAADLALVLGVGLEEFTRTTERVQLRGNTDSEPAKQAIEVFQSFVRNWQMVDALRSLDQATLADR